MKLKYLLFTIVALLLNCSFVGSQSIQGLLVPKTNQSSVVLPQSKLIQQVENNRDTIINSKSYTLPKGYLLPKKGQSNTFLPQGSGKMIPDGNNTVSVNPVSNVPVTVDQQQNNLSSLNNDIQSQSGETVDTTGFSRIQTLQTTPVPAPVSSGMEQVDTARLLNIRNNPSSGIETVTHSVETVDTTRLLNNKNKIPEYLTSHFSSSSETVDTATFLARLKPVINQDSLDYINNKPKPVYKSQTITGTFLPEKGKNNMIKPLEIDTATYLAPLPVVKDNFNFPGSDNYPANNPKGIGQLSDLTAMDTMKPVRSTQLGELAELPDAGNSNNNSSGPGSLQSGTRVDDFYKFNDGTVYYDTSKVLTNTRGRSFTGSLISKPGKSAVLQPTVNQNDVPVQSTTTSNDTKSEAMSGATVDAADNNSNSPVNNTNNVNYFQGTGSELKATFYINHAGKITLCFSCNAYYINITQWGYISDYVFRSNNKKDQANNTIHKNALGMVDNIGGSAIEYTDEHLVTKVGSWPISYTFDNMISSVGEYKVGYNSSSNVKKIDRYKVNYDFNKSILSIDDSGGLIILKTEEKKN